eukprot:NODE_188_length_13518_cov_0.721142.p4 type:complete len:449 gc:universal NODE_188_length_13518_cov_0.721142:2929-4275(+)
MTTLVSYHVRSASASSAEIHSDLSKMPSFIMREDHSKWGRLKNKISKIFVKEDMLMDEFLEENPTTSETLIEKGNAPSDSSSIFPTDRKRMAIDRAKSFKKDIGTQKRRKTSLPAPERSLTRRWTESRHKPVHPPVVEKETHPISYICSTQNPLITLPRTMTEHSFKDIDKIEKKSTDNIEKVEEWIYRRPLSSSTITSFGEDSEVSWRPYKSQPALLLNKSHSTNRKFSSWHDDSVYDSYLENFRDQTSDDISHTACELSPCSSYASGPNITILNSHNNSSDKLYRNCSLLDFKKRSESLGLMESVQLALLPSEKYQMEPIKLKTNRNRNRNRQCGLMEALKMDLLEIESKLPRDSVFSESSEDEISFLEAIQEMEPISGKMQPKAAGWVPKSTKPQPTTEKPKSKEMSEVLAQHSDNFYSPSCSHFIERDSALFIDDEDLFCTIIY